MHTTDLMQLAPTLSAKERYKLIVPDFHREMMDEKPLLSESERQAITKFDRNRAVWEEYTTKINMLQWATTLWPKDIEAERLRVFACLLLMNHAREMFVVESDNPLASKKTRNERMEAIKERVAAVNECSVKFYAYQAAIDRIEQELYGVPIFNEKKKKQIADCYEAIEDLAEYHNRVIHCMCEHKAIKKFVKPIAQDMESYLVKKPVPGADVIEQIVSEIRQIAEAETEMLGR